MSSPTFLVIKGEFVIVGKEPDGDSVRFIASDKGLKLYKQLHRGYRIKPSKGDNSVQLRFEGVDAPELHYGSSAQALGAEARDQLLGWLGFHDIVYAESTTGQPASKVNSAQPESIPGAILTQAAEANGRPVSYVLLADDAQELKEGKWTYLDEELLKKTLNYRLLEEGTAYYTAYTSTPFSIRQTLREIAQVAQEAQKGVWAIDRSESFQLVDQSSIDTRGQLILPKLFRRSTDYLKDVARGYQGNLADWIIKISAEQSRSENDLVLVNESIEVRLSDLLEQRNSTVVFKADLLDIVFVEK